MDLGLGVADTLEERVLEYAIAGPDRELNRNQHPELNPIDTATVLARERDKFS
jgi:hypothetical protein